MLRFPDGCKAGDTRVPGHCECEGRTAWVLWVVANASATVTYPILIDHEAREYARAHGLPGAHRETRTEYDDRVNATRGLYQAMPPTPLPTEWPRGTPEQMREAVLRYLRSRASRYEPWSRWQG